MPGSGYAHSDFPLSDTLSARSYLELHRDETVQAQHRLPPRATEYSPTDSSNFQVWANEVNNTAESGPPCLQSREQRPIRPDSEMTGISPGIKDLLQKKDRSVRKRGRPRIESPKDAAAIEERRLQIRRAQRTYRQKKEATIQTLRTRVDHLERTLQTVSDLLTAGPKDIDGPMELNDLLHARQLALAEVDKACMLPVNESDPVLQTTESLRDIFDRDGSRDLSTPIDHRTRDLSYEHAGSPIKRPFPHPYGHPRSPSPLLNRLFPPTTIYTYSNQESCLSRRLQRFCLEHTYRWLSDSNSDPHLMTRVFGLFPCIQDMLGVRRGSRRILQSEIGGPLELTRVAFYTLGGAGTHYPLRNADGEPIYPVNRRRPGKIVRRLARILRRGGIADWDEDWSGNLEPDDGDEQGEKIRSMSEEERLRALDLDGDWFDCRDIQGYLEDRGFVLDNSSLWLEVPASTVEALYGFSLDSGSNYCASQLYVSPGETCSRSGSQDPELSTCRYSLNVECFFDLLLSNLRMLGRAPGFRLWDVEAALRSAIHRRPF